MNTEEVFLIKIYYIIEFCGSRGENAISYSNKNEFL